MSLIIANNKITIKQSGESIKKSDLQKYKEHLEKIDDLFPLILPSIKYHDHDLLERIFQAGVNPNLAITKFGTLPRYEAAECYACREIVKEAEKDYVSKKIIEMYFSSLPSQSSFSFGKIPRFEVGNCYSYKTIVERPEKNYDSELAVKSSTEKADVLPVISKKRKLPEVGMPVNNKQVERSKKQVLDCEPDFGNEEMDRLVYTGNPADFEF